MTWFPTHTRMALLVRLSLFLTMATLGCCHAGSVRRALPPNQIRERITMTMEYEAQITRQIVEYEATHLEAPAIFASNELVESDPYAPTEVDAEYRQQSRLRRVAL
jgi:hypothetical protein